MVEPKRGRGTLSTHRMSPVPRHVIFSQHYRVFYLVSVGSPAKRNFSAFSNRAHSAKRNYRTLIPGFLSLPGGP